MKCFVFAIERVSARRVREGKRWKADAVIGLFGLQTLSAATQIYHAMCTLDLRGRRQQLRRKQPRILLVSLLVVLAAAKEKLSEINFLIA
jgi:hypothetical protein